MARVTFGVPGWDERIVSMVAHHSCAVLEAEERGLSADLEEFARPPGEYEDAVCFCDMTTGPDGLTVDVRDRLDEIEVRYGPDHLVTRFIRRARPEILSSVSRVEDHESLPPLPRQRCPRVRARPAERGAEATPQEGVWKGL